MPHAILYRSVATHPVGPLSLRALTVRSAQRNARAGITGVLLHGTHEHVEGLPGAFLQWIEGPEAEVRSLYARLEQDPRHDRLEVLADGPLAEIAGTGERLFPGWDLNAESIGDLPASLDGFLAYARRQRRDGGWTRAA